MQNSLITIITIPVQADIMAVDLTVAGITVAVLMAVAVADIRSRDCGTTFSPSDAEKELFSTRFGNLIIFRVRQAVNSGFKNVML